ncbi:MAG: hypothetical protein AAF682_22270 [Planctomycetota bacterium]
MSDARSAAASRRVGGFLLLAAQLALLLGVFHVFELEGRTFRFVAAAAFGAFALHYWLPFRWKEPFLVLVSMAAAPLLLQPATGYALLLAGTGLFLICALPAPYRVRVALASAYFTVAIAARGLGFLGVPEQFWPVFGGIFGLRALGYLYDLQRVKGRPDPVAFGAYFFQLPNYCFLFYPVVDYETMRKTWYRRDIHAIAQEGVQWITRGVVQLLLYRLLYHELLPPSTPDAIASPAKLVQVIVVTYLLYLRLSGQFHIIVGMLHLFGYDLPETHRRYLLASSLTDFWRRINIYWKDFMVKLVYFPVVFRLRRSGDLRAQIVATVAVFSVTWLLHGYVKYWWSPSWPFNVPDALFWGVLGLLVIVNVVLESRSPRARSSPGLGARLLHGAKVAATFAFISFLWYLWQRPTLGDWLELITWWQIG